MDRLIIANVDRDMRSPGITSSIEEQEIKRLILVGRDRVFYVVPQIARSQIGYVPSEVPQ